jgi:hypothetical protein
MERKSDPKNLSTESISTDVTAGQVRKRNI